MARNTTHTTGSLSGVLPELVRAQGWEKQLEVYTLLGRWQDLVDEELGGYARPLKVERGVLWLEVENSSWLQQLQYEKMALLATLNGLLRLSRLKDVRMVLPTSPGRQSEPRQTPRLCFVTPDPEAVTAFRRQVEAIADSECREALFRLWYLAQACRRKTF